MLYNNVVGGDYLISYRFNRFLPGYRFILYLDHCSFIGVESASLQVTSLLYVHRFIMMSPLFKAILKFQNSFTWTNHRKSKDKKVT